MQAFTLDRQAIGATRADPAGLVGGSPWAVRHPQVELDGHFEVNGGGIVLAAIQQVKFAQRQLASEDPLIVGQQAYGRRVFEQELPEPLMVEPHTAGQRLAEVTLQLLRGLLKMT